jgi:hypothetical protein
MPRLRWRSKLMVRTSLTVPFEPTRAPKSQVDQPKFAPSRNPQYQCGFRAIREETKDRSRDALHRPCNSAYSFENTGTPGETTPIREVPKVTLSAMQSDFVRNAAAMRWEEGPDVSPTEAHPKVPQKVTPWKNDLIETKRPTGFFARPPVTPCGSQFEAPFLPHSSPHPDRFFPEKLPRMVSRSVSNRFRYRWTVRFVPTPSLLPSPCHRASHFSQIGHPHPALTFLIRGGLLASPLRLR